MPKALFVHLKQLKFKKNDPYEGLKLIESFAFSRYILTSESINNYFSRIRFKKRKIIVLLQQLCMWIYIFKSIFIYSHNTKTFIRITADFTDLYPRPDILNLTIINVFLNMALICKN